MSERWLDDQLESVRREVALWSPQKREVMRQAVALPPGSDPSPAPCLDAKEMMRDVFTSWLKHRAAILTSPAEPAATDVMERARKIVRKYIKLGVRFIVGPRIYAESMQDDIAAAITSAVEQERQALITRDFGDGKFVISYGYFNGKAALFIEPAPVPGTVGASADSSGLKKTECVAGGIVMTFANSASAAVLRDQLEMASRLIESSRSRSAEPPNTEGGE